MEPIGRPGDDFRKRLLRSDIERILMSHGIPLSGNIISEPRGNEMVAYHLDGYFLSFGLNDDTQRKVEVLRLFEHLDAIPTPKVIAWSEKDPKLNVPYMILERCPGLRLDVLWEACGSGERLQLLEDLGKSMGRYHTITLDDAEKAAALTGTERWVIDSSRSRFRRAEQDRVAAKHALERLSERLGRWDIDGSSLVTMLENHYARELPSPSASFVGTGLIHAEPDAEHFIFERRGDAFAMTGCVDLEECQIADSIDDVVGMHVSMLALDRTYLDAFRRGYEAFFTFPPDAEERLHPLAIDSDLWAILWLLDTMEKNPEKWSFATRWVIGHVDRLRGWLDESKRVTRALFRKDIGPW